MIAEWISLINEIKNQTTTKIPNSKQNKNQKTFENPKTNAKGGVAAWPDVQKSSATLGNLTPADRHGSVQV